MYHDWVFSKLLLIYAKNFITMIFTSQKFGRSETSLGHVHWPGYWPVSLSSCPPPSSWPGPSSPQLPLPPHQGTPVCSADTYSVPLWRLKTSSCGPEPPQCPAPCPRSPSQVPWPWLQHHRRWPKPLPKVLKISAVNQHNIQRSLKDLYRVWHSTSDLKAYIVELTLTLFPVLFLTITNIRIHFERQALLTSLLGFLTPCQSSPHHW